MRLEAQIDVKTTQDNYGRWFVEVRETGRKRAPIRCLSEQDARAVADRMLRGAFVRDQAA